eukprot:jgi/Mesen1/8980/ME000056S08392
MYSMNISTSINTRLFTSINTRRPGGGRGHPGGEDGEDNEDVEEENKKSEENQEDGDEEEEEEDKDDAEEEDDEDYEDYKHKPEDEYEDYEDKTDEEAEEDEEDNDEDDAHAGASKEMNDGQGPHVNRFSCLLAQNGRRDADRERARVQLLRTSGTGVPSSVATAYKKRRQDRKLRDKHANRD